MSEIDHAHRIARFVQSIQSDLKKSDPRRRKVRTILNACGWQRRNSQNLARINSALAEAEIYARPPLTMRVSSAATVQLSKTRPIGMPMEFADESDLRDFLVLNFANVKAFQDLRDPLPECRIGKFQIDILARSRTDNAYVAIELKRRSGDIVGQMTRYLAAIDQAKAKGKFPVRGIIVTSVPEPTLARAHRRIGGFDISWMTYRVDCQLDPVTT